MDAIQFGRWLADRRRDGGWVSQRALALAAQAHPRTSSLAISEAFVARLEAGLLLHPFRGAARRRAIGLAWLLCDSARQARMYIKLAELNDLSRVEATEIESLIRSLSESGPRHDVVLPPPPSCLLGRSGELATLTSALSRTGGGCTIITGMPGIGKTALALAAVNQLVTGDQGAVRFVDGIHYISCAGRHGAGGASSLLMDVLALLDLSERPAAPRDRASDADAGAHESSVDEHTAASDAAALARATNRTRQALASKQVLVILDDVEPDLLLDMVVEALLPFSVSRLPASPAASHPLTAPAVLVTSRYLPRVSPNASHLHLQPLTLEDGVRLIEHVLGRSLDADERTAALRLCAAVGGVPLALVAAATVLVQTRLPLALLAIAAERNPLAILRTGTGSSSSASSGPSDTNDHTRDHLLARSLDALPTQVRQQLALLSVLRAESFGLDAVAALRQQTPARAAMLAGELVRHSLLEPERVDAGETFVARAVTEDSGATPATLPMHDTRFRLPPLLRAYAAEQAQSLPPAMTASARRNLGAYADEYVECHIGDTPALEAEEQVLRAALHYTVRDSNHERTVRLVWGLLPIVTRQLTCDDIVRLVLAGVRAGKLSADQRLLVPLLNFLGIVRFYQGDHVRARRAWMHGMQVAADLRTPDPTHGFLYGNLAYLADLEGEPEVAWHLGELGIHYSRKAEDAHSMGKVLLAQAERARRRGEQQTAYAYAYEGQEVVDAAGKFQTAPDVEKSALAARVKLARIERDYATASQCASQYLALWDSQYCLFLTQDLIEQAEYALEAGANQDAMRLADHALTIAKGAQATGLARRADGVRLRAGRHMRLLCGDTAEA